MLMKRQEQEKKRAAILCFCDEINAAEGFCNYLLQGRGKTECDLCKSTPTQNGKMTPII